MKKAIPSRITEAREARALSMGELADDVNVTRQSVSKYERGIISPSAEIIQAISNRLMYPVDFFYKDEPITAAQGSSLFFRSNSNISKKVKTACKCQIKWANEIKKDLERYVDFLVPNISAIDGDYADLSDADIEELTLQIRKAWGLGTSPVVDLIGILENRGVITSQLAENTFCSFKGIDAFSSWDDGTPYILYHPTQKSAVRTRFSILHELGHLVMHNAISNEDAVKREVIDFADMQADHFAAAFLLPATTFPNDIRSTSLASLEAVKHKWGASFSTIIRRCETLNLLSDNQLAYLKRQMTIKKYWHKEPLDDILQIKGPEMLKDAVLMLVNNNVVARDAFLSSIAFSANDLKYICSLPDTFFSGYDDRQKPVLKVLK